MKLLVVLAIAAAAGACAPPSERGDSEPGGANQHSYTSATAARYLTSEYPQVPPEFQEAYRDGYTDGAADAQLPRSSALER